MIPGIARSEERAPFKQCPVCRHIWERRDDLLSDPGIALVGYQVSFKRLTSGLFLFNHACKGATLALQAIEFRDLYQGPVFKDRATGGSECPGHCLHSDDLRSCPASCECAFVREIIQIIRSWPKGAGSFDPTIQ